MREFPLHSPALPPIEADSEGIRFDNAKPEGFTITLGYFSFTLCEQSFPDTLPPSFPEHPQVTDPLVARQDHPHDTSVDDSDPSGGPVLFVDE